MTHILPHFIIMTVQNHPSGELPISVTDPKSQAKHYDVAIIGAGTVGMLCAILLAQRGYQVIILDNKPAPSQASFDLRLAQRDARVYALNRSSIDLFKSADVWDGITRRADYDQMRVWARDDFGELIFEDERAFENIMLGSMVEPSVLDEALWRRAQACDNLTLKYEISLAAHGMAFDEMSDGVCIRYQADNQAKMVKAKLLLGADGRASLVRREMGIGIDRLDYHQKAICCAIRTDQPHDNTARQVMLPTGTLALLPIADLNQQDQGRWQSIVWSLPEQIAEAYLSDYHQNPKSLIDRLALASGYVLGDIHEVQSVASFPLSAQTAKRYHKGLIALMGDAAHGVHPLAGQGLNLGLSDVKALITLIDEYRTKNLPLSARLLGEYERAVKGHNSMMMHSFSMINFAYASALSDIPVIRYARSEIVKAISKSPSVMRLLIERANR